jgi:hypothetical protein
LKSYLAEDVDGEEPEVTNEDNEPPHVYEDAEPIEDD